MAYYSEEAIHTVSDFAAREVVRVLTGQPRSRPRPRPERGQHGPHGVVADRSSFVAIEHQSRARIARLACAARTAAAGDVE